MRIGIDIKAFKNGTTGIARYLRCLMDELQEADEQNEYVLFEPRSLDYQPTNPRWKKVTVATRLPGTIWLQCVLPFHLKRHRIDVLWAPEQVCPIVLPRSISVVTTVHDLAFRHFPESFVWSNLLIQKLSAPLVFRRSRFITAVSEFIGREVVGSYPRSCRPDKVVVVSNGAPKWQLPPDYRFSHRKDFLFFAGNLEPRKNLVTLIKALEILHDRGLDFNLHLAGPAGWRNARLHHAIESSSVKDNIHLLGYLTEDELKEQYLTCRALVYPSLYEGFGIPVLEAFAMDCPVVTSKGTAMEEIAGECAVYADPTNPASLAEKIVSTLERRTTLQSSVRSVLDKYTWAASAKRLLETFESCISAPDGGGSGKEK